MEAQLRMLQRREAELRESLVERFGEMLSDLLPRTHLHYAEHGNPVVIRLELALRYEGAETLADMEMTIQPVAPRAKRACRLKHSSHDRP